MRLEKGKDIGAKRGSNEVNFADALSDEYARTSFSNNFIISLSYLVAACRRARRS
jgi:hypothetical protein